MTSAERRLSQPVRSCERDGCDHVGHAATARDQSRPAVDHRVEDRSRLVVTGIRRTKQLPAELLLQLLHRGLLESGPLGFDYLRTHRAPP
jgi:hypothetical protein